jgi:hypothetical protein
MGGILSPISSSHTHVLEEPAFDNMQQPELDLELLRPAQMQQPVLYPTSAAGAPKQVAQTSTQQAGCENVWPPVLAWGAGARAPPGGSSSIRQLPVVHCPSRQVTTGMVEATPLLAQAAAAGEVRQQQGPSGRQPLAAMPVVLGRPVLWPMPGIPCAGREGC